MLFRSVANWETGTIQDNMILKDLKECTNVQCSDKSTDENGNEEFVNGQGSPWLGFIPLPNCPPGYRKVATINPIRFNMSMAGIPYGIDKISDSRGLSLHMRTDPRGDKVFGSNGNSYRDNASTYVDVIPAGEDGSGSDLGKDREYLTNIYNSPLTFQVNTWLNTTLKAYRVTSENTEKLKGWHAVMGFIYSGQDYCKYF